MRLEILDWDPPGGTALTVELFTAVRARELCGDPSLRIQIELPEGCEGVRLSEQEARVLGQTLIAFADAIKRRK